jgi:preprotein translocase SecE subunit
MSVAETPAVVAPTPRDPQQQLAIGSAIGAMVLLAGLGFVFGGLPWLWNAGWNAMFPPDSDLGKNVFLSAALLIIVDLAVVAGLAYGAYLLLQKYTQPGLRAGIFFFAIYLFASMWVVIWLGSQIEGADFDFEPAVGTGLLLLILAALLAGALYVFLKVPSWPGFLETVENQGWFHAYSYKASQGVRVRRGTIVGVIAIGVAGLYTLGSNRYFGVEYPATATTAAIPNDWTWPIPFTEPRAYAYLMFKMHMIMPIVLGVALLWLAWRIVNFPAFADFLVATEAEMNKVSWTNRRRLFQDTIVVLTTVVLMTAFLFVIDMVWIKVLMLPGIQVLQIDPAQAAKEQQEKAQW